MLFLPLFLIVVVLLATHVQGQAYSQRRRRTKELEEKITKLDDGTKQRIYAMKASGMPHDAIAEKISYQAGGKTTAKRIVDAMMEDPTVRKPAKKPQQKASTQQKANTAPKKTNSRK